MISLFEVRPTHRSFPYGYIASSAMHLTLLPVFAFAVTHNPLVVDPSVPLYKVQIVNLHSPLVTHEIPTLSYQPSDRVKKAPRRNHASEMQSEASKPGGSRERARGASPQTLLRPTQVSRSLSERVPIPALLMVSKTNSAQDRVSPPLQHAEVPNAMPQLEVPVEEDVADALIPPSPLSNATLPLPTTTISPIADPASISRNKLPTSLSDADPSTVSTNALSISDVHLANGATSLPLTNEIEGTEQKDIAVLGGKTEASKPGLGERGAGSRAGQGSAESLGTRHFTLPQNGRFGIVVVGASLEELYPETSTLWGNRLAYTVYLNVGTDKPWILQYSLCGSELEANGSAPKSLDPPWPIDVLVPNIEGQINADALLVHGYLSESGRLENLSVAFPPGFPWSQFVVDSLRQWRFRPAKQGNQAVRVEVLLIIPRGVNSQEVNR